MKFKLLDADHTGIDFNNTIQETHMMNIITYPDFYSGGGVSIGDIDNDGLQDVFFTGNQVSPRLYRNLGDMVFEDITETSLDKVPKGWYTGTAMTDVNADGHLDIYVCRSGMAAPEDRANLLYINNGDGTFTESAGLYGLDNQGYGVSANFFDYDKDGDLDVYVTNQFSSRLNASDAARLRGLSHPYAGDRLYENTGNGFVDVTEKAGLYSSEVGFAHGAAVGDINNDGWDDIFLSNDFFEYDYLYINNGDKTFTENMKNAMKHISNFSMGNDIADFNNDGFLDIIVLDMVAEDNRRLYMNTGGNDQRRFERFLHHGLHYQYMFNVLHMNNGNMTFSEIGTMAGIARTDWSWAPLFADFDNDGWKDLYVTNGIRKDIRNIDWGFFYRNITQFVNNFTEIEASQWDMLLNSLPHERITNYMFRNNGDLTFSKMMKDWDMDYSSFSNGAAYGDLDNDGDLDLIVNNVDAEAYVYENRQKGNNFLRFTFEGPAGNPLGLGTRVRIHHGDKMQYMQHYLSRGYRSSMEPALHFGLGTDTLVSRVEVIWPDGRISVMRSVPANKVILTRYADASNPEILHSGETIHYFKEVTREMGLQVRHREQEAKDFMFQSMLHYKLSDLGPPLAVQDVNGDGLEDFFLGGAYRYPAQLFLQDSSGQFESAQEDTWNQDVNYEDVGAAFFDIDNDHDQDLYVVGGGFEYIKDPAIVRDRMYLNDGKGNFTRRDDLIPEMLGSGSVAVPFDFDRDGDMDLFVGGRMAAGNYPRPADSYMLINKGGRLEDMTDQIAPAMRELGLATDAVASDYDLDGDLDLIVVGEWMPVTLFRNDDGIMVKVVDEDNGLRYTNGWWWHINAADIDQDGDTDYILGNMGLNYKFRADRNTPLELFILEDNPKERVDFLIGYHQDGDIFPTTDRARTIRQFPHIKGRIPSNDEYALLTLGEIHGEDVLRRAVNRKIYLLESGYLENRGKGIFTFHSFDHHAQISNVNTSIIKDVDRDGNLDLILAGNLHSIEAEAIRNDAGTGLWMKGNGKGNFTSIPGYQSGLFIDGDVRQIRMIKINAMDHILTASNQDSIQVHRIEKVIPLK